MPFAFADTQIDLAVTSNESVNSNIYCVGYDCSYNLYGDFENNFSVNQYDITNVQSYNGGWSLPNFINNIKYQFIYEERGQILSDTMQEFFDLLSFKFVTRNEYNTMKNNMNYLVSEVDYLKAELRFLKEKYNMTNNDNAVEVYKTLEASKRKGFPVVNGDMVCDYADNPNDCIVVKSVSK